MKRGRVIAAYMHKTMAVGISVLHQTTDLGVHASFKKSQKEDGDFKYLIQIVKAHIHITILLLVPVDHFLCCKNGSAHDTLFVYADLFGWSNPEKLFQSV